jgi:hypothetical protein
MIAVAFLVGLGCSPDLVSISDKTGFCEVNDQNQLLINVKNQGSEDAGASTTQVIFGTYGTENIVTPALNEGDGITLPPVNFPEGCFDSDCGFTIKVDIFNDVSEGSNEDNNEQIGNCIG